MHYDNYNLHCVISIHALLAESDPASSQSSAKSTPFLSTLSLRRATRWTSSKTSRQIFLSTLSLRRATMTDGSICFDSKISIHALLAESDYCQDKGQCATRYFYPRSPCGERRTARTQKAPSRGISIHALLAESDSIPFIRSSAVCIFLSTLSLRRATIISPHSTPDNSNFYPRSPCGERHEQAPCIV